MFCLSDSRNVSNTEVYTQLTEKQEAVCFIASLQIIQHLNKSARNEM